MLLVVIIGPGGLPPSENPLVSGYGGLGGLPRFLRYSRAGGVGGWGGGVYPFFSAVSSPILQMLIRNQTAPRKASRRTAGSSSPDLRKLGVPRVRADLQLAATPRDISRALVGNLFQQVDRFDGPSGKRRKRSWLPRGLRTKEANE